MQIPLEIENLQLTVANRNPKIIVEIGTWKGDFADFLLSNSVDKLMDGMYYLKNKNKLIYYMIKINVFLRNITLLEKEELVDVCLNNGFRNFIKN